MASDMQSNINFHSWVKTSLALLYLKEGISDDINQKASDMHNDIKQVVQQKYPKAVSSSCNHCNSKSIKTTKQPNNAGTQLYINCRSDVCNHWLDQLIQYHEHLPRPNVEWANCDPTLWPSDSWEVAKVFQPYGCATHRNAEDSDIAGLLTFMLNCKFFNRFLTNKQILKDIKEIRNRTMHSSTLEIDENDMITWLDKMAELLEDPKHFNGLPACKTAAYKIKQLKNKPMETSFDKEGKETALSQLIASLTGEMSSLRSAIDDIVAQSHDEMKRNISTATTDISQIKEEMKTLQTSVNDLCALQSQNKLPLPRDQFDNLSKQLGELRSTFKDRISVLESEMSVAKTGLSTVKKCSEQNTETIETMRHEMGALKAELSEVQRQIPHHSIEHRVDWKSIQTHLISLYNRHCQKVPVYPLTPEWRENVDKLFVKPSMLEMNIQVSKQKQEEKKVKEISDIFHGEKQYRDIYIVAESGSGKSTLCEFLVYLWVKQHSGMDCKEKKPGDERFMEEFVFLFYISLRDANNDGDCDIEEMIRSQLEVDLNRNKKFMEKMLSEHTCLIILDGLDEYSLKHLHSTRFVSACLPWRRHSDKCTILTTSRPWKLEILASELGDQIERQIRITGLESKSQEDLAETVVSLLNGKDGQNKKSSDFIQDMNKLKLDKYMKTPILLLQMLGLWFDGESFGNSQCEIYAKMIEKQIQFAAEVKKIPAASNKEYAKLPDCFNGLRHSQNYGKLLLKLSKLAYNFLYGSKTSVLVFNHEQMEILNLSQEDIQSCLNLGLLTQYKVLRKITERQKSISFVHKSHQEFFAAIYIWQIGLGAELNILLDGFTDLENALQVEKVLTFVSGMNPVVASEIANAFMSLWSPDDPKIRQYRESCLSLNAPQTELVKQMQGIILSAIEESTGNGQIMPAIRLQDIWMCGGDQDYPPSRILTMSESLQLSDVRSIYIHGPFNREESGGIWRLVENASRQLHKIVICNCDIYVPVLQKVVHGKGDSLQVIGFNEVNNLSCLDEPTLTSILSANCLALSDIALTHDNVKLVYQHLGRRSHKQVVLEGLHCKNKHFFKSCKPRRIVLLDSQDLNLLKLRNLQLEEVVFPTKTSSKSLINCEIEWTSPNGTASVVRSLRAACDLETFICSNKLISSAVNRELVKSLPHLNALRNVTLYNFDVTCAKEHVFPDHMSALEKIKLNEFTLTAKELKHLLTSLPSHRVHVNLWHVTITDYDINDDIIDQTVASPRTEVIKSSENPKVTYTDNKCDVNKFHFYHKK